jgi:hypothetical protein
MKLAELLAESEDKPQWYIVRLKDDAISAGPFDTKPSDMQVMTYQWYNNREYSVEFGISDENDTFKEVKQ